MKIMVRSICTIALVSLAEPALGEPFRPPIIRLISPASGPSSGGGVLSVNGTGFQRGLSISVGGVACSSPAFVTSTQATCTLPAGTVGPKNVVLTNFDGQSATLPQAFSYVFDIVDGETNLGIIRDWPSIPPNFEIPNYPLFAKHYYELAFSSSEHMSSEGRKVFGHTRFVNGATSPALEPYFPTDFPTLLQASFFDSLHAAQNPLHQSESLTVFPGIISSALMSEKSDLGIRRSEIASYVRMMKRYFHPLALTGHPSLGWFGNHPVKDTANGGSFWYDLGPNVYAMQLLSLFKNEEIEPPLSPSEESFDQLCHRMANTLYTMTEFLKQGPTSIPSFDYAAVKIVDGQLRAYDTDCSDNRPDPMKRVDPEKLFCPRDFTFFWNNQKRYCSDLPPELPRKDTPWQCFDNPNAYEPSAAGAFVYIGLAAYERWGEAKYLKMADAALQFLQHYDRNPVYELVFNHGILAAARMNQKHNKTYDIDKLVRWAFVRSDNPIDPKDRSTWPNIETNARPDVGILNNMWGSYPTFGLWGAKGKPGALGTDENLGGIGYAFYMNTISQAVTLAPLAKYEPKYAPILARYLLHVASNAKYFFSQYVPSELQDPTTYQALSNQLDSRYRSIPFEGFRENATTSGTKILLKGDAVEHNWAKTDLSAYSGALTGMFASMLIRDSNNASGSNPIVFWDLNVTDLPATKSYPSYLVYNPTGSEKTVTLKRSDIRTHGELNFRTSPHNAAWDLISNRWIYSGSGDISFTLKPGEATVFSLVPHGHSCQQSQARLTCKTNGADFSVLDYQL